MGYDALEMASLMQTTNKTRCRLVGNSHIVDSAAGRKDEQFTGALLRLSSEHITILL